MFPHYVDKPATAATWKGGNERDTQEPKQASLRDETGAKLEVKTVNAIHVKSLDKRYGAASRTSISVLTATIKLAGDPTERVIHLINPDTYALYDKPGYAYNLIEFIEAWVNGKTALSGFEIFRVFNNEVHIKHNVFYGARAGLTATVSVHAIERLQLAHPLA